MLVHATGMPYVESVGSDVVVLYSGCAPHMCPYEGGAMVYSVERHELFNATYVADRKPKLQYSPNVLNDGNKEYKKRLDELLREHNFDTNE
jgi:hypothetical protein